MPTVSLPLQICLPLLVASVMALAVLGWNYMRCVQQIRQLAAQNVQEWSNDADRKLNLASPKNFMAQDVDVEVRLGLLRTRISDPRYVPLMRRARIFYWLSILSVVALVVSLGLTLQDF